MGTNTEVTWATHSFNPWIGCSKVSPACANCYAEREFDKRLGRAKWGPNGTRVMTKDWRKPLKWNREAEATGVRPRVFCASLADVFEDWQGPILDHNGEQLWVHRSTNGQLRSGHDDGWMHVNGWSEVTMDDLRYQLFALIDATPNLDWLILTKRPENIRHMWPVKHDSQPIFPGAPGKLGEPVPCVVKGARRDNVWLGTSVENQEQADKRIPELLAAHHLAPVCFLSCEPLLGQVNLGDALLCPGCGGTGEVLGPFGESLLPCDHHFNDGGRIDWIISGGESGPNARPSHPDWFRSLRDQCLATGAPFHFKQWGEWAPSSGSEPILPLMDKSRHGVFVGDEWRIDEGTASRYENLSGQMMYRVGKKAAGRLLDGVEHNGFPTPEPTTA